MANCVQLLNFISFTKTNHVSMCGLSTLLCVWLAESMLNSSLSLRHAASGSTEVNLRVVPRQNAGEAEVLSAPSCPHSIWL